jgi:hypothetical protein
MNIQNVWRQWRAINTILIVVGMMMPWYYIEPIEEVANDYSPLAGWESIYNAQVWVIGHFRFDWHFIPFILMGIGGFFVFLYLIYNFLVIIQRIKNKGLKFIPFILIGVNIVFSFKWLLIFEK